MNFTEIQDREIRRLKTKLSQMTNDLVKAKTELSIVRDDRDTFIKMNAEKHSQLHALNEVHQNSFSKLERLFSDMKDTVCDKRNVKLVEEGGVCNAYNQ